MLERTESQISGLKEMINGVKRYEIMLWKRKNELSLKTILRFTYLLHPEEDPYEVGSMETRALPSNGNRNVGMIFMFK